MFGAEKNGQFYGWTPYYQQPLSPCWLRQPCRHLILFLHHCQSLQGFEDDGSPPLILPVQWQLKRNGVDVGRRLHRRIPPSSAAKTKTLLLCRPPPACLVLSAPSPPCCVVYFLLALPCPAPSARPLLSCCPPPAQRAGTSPPPCHRVLLLSLPALF